MQPSIVRHPWIWRWPRTLTRVRLVRGSVAARLVSDSFQCSSCLARLNMAECDRVSAADDDDDIVEDEDVNAQNVQLT